MSPWPHKELRVIVCPDHVTAAPVLRKPTLRGVQRVMLEPRVSFFESEGGAQSWRSALRELETVLPSVANARTATTVVLSNQFVRYVVVPWRAGLSDAQEELSYARHCFAQVLSPATLRWEVRLSQEPAERSRVASAVDAELLDGLRSVFRNAGVALKSIQPHLMAAFNSAKGRLRQRNAWLALIEPGHVCVALLRDAQWSRVRSLRIERPWREELATLLEREALLADDTTEVTDVYLGHLEESDGVLPELDGWRLHALHAAPPGTSASAQGAHPALAMAG